MTNNKLNQIMLDAVSELHRKSTLERSEQWFRRSEIARQLGATGGLNPVRVAALRHLVEDQKLLLRQKPNDGRDLPQYQLP